MSNFSAISCREQTTFWLDDNDVHFVLDHHAALDLHSANALKQHSAPLRHIIPIMSQPVFALSP
jgi:hypothetical protein